MSLLHIILSAIIQGITEFLPISSSGHLVLLHGIAGQTNDQANLILDIAVHIGTLFAVLIYFRRDVMLLAGGILKILTGNVSSTGAQLGLKILTSSIPVIIAGLALHMINPYWLRETWVVATTTLIFGVLLWFIDDFKSENRTAENATFKDALIIGLAQILALIPGTSRSGITMTAARSLGFTRTESARYSLLLSIIAISGAGILGAKDLLDTNTPALTADIAIAITLSFSTALGAITLMMKWLTTQSFKAFAIYRILLGLGLFAALGLGLIS